MSRCLMNKIIHMPPAQNIALFDILMDAASYSPGRFIEMGVYKADTFDHIYRSAKRFKREAVGLDSFIGHPDPRSPGEENQHKGKHAAGGSCLFREKYPDAICIEGFIPEILNDIEPSEYAFAHIDLDHQLTTMEALEWIWPQMSDGGIMICHDYSVKGSVAAAKAIGDWMSKTGINYIGLQDTSIFFRKGVA